MSITQITRVSTGASGAEGNAGSSQSTISADGRFVAFYSEATNLVPGDTNGVGDVFVKDLQTGAVTRVSTDAAGVQGNNTNYRLSMSADGRFVAFESDATNLVTGDTSGQGGVFVKDLQTGAVTRVSADAAGVPANGWSIDPSISADGRFVSFTSWAANLVPEDTDDQRDVFVKDLQTGAVQRVGMLGEKAAISANGHSVAFVSAAGNLVPADTNLWWDVFVEDLQTGAVVRVSTDAVGGQANDYSESVSLSADGRFVAFYSFASNLVPGDTNGSGDVFIKDLQTGAVARLNVDAAGGQVGMRNDEPFISADGGFVVFSSSSANLVPGDSNGATDVFVVPNPLLPYASMTLTTGNDTWTGTAGGDMVFALAGDDSLDGAAGNDSLVGADGNDTLVGGDGADTLSGGQGDDVYRIGAGDLIFGEPAGQGLDRVYSSASFTLVEGLNQLFLTGTAAVDGIGSAGNNFLAGNAGNNRLIGLGGADDIYGNDGNDTLQGGSSNDTLRGGAGADLFDFSGAEATSGYTDFDVITDYSRADGDVVDLHYDGGYIVVGVVNGNLRISAAGDEDIIQFNGITSADDIVFV